MIQYYKTPQGNYALDKSTRKASQVTSIPSGSAIINWSANNLPSELRK